MLIVVKVTFVVQLKFIQVSIHLGFSCCNTEIIILAVSVKARSL